MPQDVRWQLYDTWQPSTVASLQTTLFQVSQGGDANHPPNVTNMRGAGSLPQTEKMVVDKIKVQVDKALPIADLSKWFYGTILEIIVANTQILQLPVSSCIAQSGWSGSLQETSPADTPTVGLWGEGFSLLPVINLAGAIPFKVNVTQNLALSAAAFIKIVLEGVYTIG